MLGLLIPILALMQASGGELGFDAPAGYVTQHNGEVVVLAPSTPPDRPPCIYGVAPDRPASGNLEPDAEAALLQSVVPGWRGGLLLGATTQPDPREPPPSVRVPEQLGVLRLRPLDPVGAARLGGRTNSSAASESAGWLSSSNASPASGRPRSRAGPVPAGGR